jgi:integrase
MRVPALPTMIVVADGSPFHVSTDGNWRPGSFRIDTRWLEWVMPAGHHNFSWDKARPSCFAPTVVQLMRLRILAYMRTSLHSASAALDDYNALERILYASGGEGGQFRIEDVTEPWFCWLAQFLKAHAPTRSQSVRATVVGLYRWALEHCPEHTAIDSSLPDALDGVPWASYQGKDLPPVPESVVLLDHRQFALPATACWRIDDVLINTRLLDHCSSGVRLFGATYRSTVFDPAFAHVCRLWLAERLRSRKPSTVQVNLCELGTFERYLARSFPDLLHDRSFGVLAITRGLFDHAVDSPHLANKARCLTVLREVYAWGVRRNLAGFDSGVLREIESQLVASEFAPYSVVGLPALPESVRLPGEDQIDAPLAIDGIWRVKPGRPINTQLLDYPKVGGKKANSRVSALDRSLSHSIRLFLAHRLENVAVGTVIADLNSGFIPFERWLAGFAGAEGPRLPASSLGGHPLMERSILPESVTTQLLEEFKIWTAGMGPGFEHSVQKVFDWYRWAAKESFPGFTTSVAERLDQTPSSRNTVGRAVRERDPAEGAYSEEEYIQIVDALAEHSGGERFARHRAVVEICVATLVRGEAICQLKREDLSFEEDERGDPVFFFSMARVKRRAGAARQILEYQIDKRVYDLVESLHSPYDHDRSRPLIPMPRGGVLTPSTVSELMNDWSRAVGLQTIRVPLTPEEALANPGGPYTSTPLRLGTRRFRHTGATMLAEQGYTAEEIADALDDRYP